MYRQQAVEGSDAPNHEGTSAWGISVYVAVLVYPTHVMRPVVWMIKNRIQVTCTLKKKTIVKSRVYLSINSSQTERRETIPSEAGNTHVER